MRVEIWSDVVCPWCYVGKRRFEEALRRFDHADAVEVVWRSFELDPLVARNADVDLVGHLAAKYDVSRAEARQMNERVTAVAAAEGLEYHLDRARRGSTLDAHRLVHLAADHGLADAVEEALMAAYFTDGEPIGDSDALARVAVVTGLEEAAVRTVLAGDAYTDEVRADERLARDLGVSGVPFFVIDRRYAVGGAQRPDVLLEVLERAWADRRPVEAAADAPS